MTRVYAKRLARSRNCKCVKGVNRDNNYNECIDAIFDHFENLLDIYDIPSNPLKYKPKRKYIHSPAEEISIIMDKNNVTCPLEKESVIGEINARFVEREIK